MRARRVFWLGAHKVLKRTELRALRALGLEVFNPAYLSPVYDQSADLVLDRDQPSTLPPDVFAALLRHDFFYRPIEPGIAELLNAYFDAAIVTINPDWLRELLAVFKGQVIYRVYGQPYSLSETLVHNRMWDTLIARPGFTVVPFAAESVEHEHRWFLDLCQPAVPYQIPEDTFAFSGTWAAAAHRPEIATSIPNVQNPYYAAAYDAFNARFPHRLFRIYGPQRQVPADSRIVGALARETMLERFAASSGYLYNYTDSVCYLPPVEFMEVGGPVLHAPGSLLHRMYKGATPGLMRDQADAERKIGLLLKGDAGFVAEVTAAQDSVRRRYDRATVRPLFDAAFGGLLMRGPEPRPAVVPEVSTARPCFVILLHIDGLFSHRKGRVYAFEGIPRVVDMIVQVLTKHGGMRLAITCTPGSMPALHDLFRDPILAGRLELVPVAAAATATDAESCRRRVELMGRLNGTADVACVLVPHYYLFPEALLLRVPTMLYLPDYFPYLMPGVVFDSSAEKDAENHEVGMAIAARAAAVLTNSAFTAAYLPDAGFATGGSGKVCVAPLPLLGAMRATALPEHEAAALRSRLGGRRFILYPTANRPNKQIAFLMRVLAAARVRHPDLLLVSTCDLNSVPAAAQACERFGLRPHVLLLPGIDEPSLRWLYEHSAALCLTSTLEGNFPPQVLEAIEYGTPAVATRLPPITEALGEAADELLLCDPLRLDDFCGKLDLALADRPGVLVRQDRVKEALRRRASPETFYQALEPVLRRLLSRRVAAGPSPGPSAGPRLPARAGSAPAGAA